MKLPMASLILVSSVFAQFSYLSAEGAPRILPVDEPDTGESRRILWDTQTDLRYLLEASEDLVNWVAVEGYPKEATARSAQHKFSLNADEFVFYRVTEIDEQPPQIVSQYPVDSGFAVPLYASLATSLKDASGIDTSSIELTVSGWGTYTPDSPELSFANDILTFDLGDSSPLGEYGQMVEVVLSVSDTLGNEVEYAWAFTLEVEPVVVEDLFVFGSESAQYSGQGLEGASALVAASTGSLSPYTTLATWDIEQVNTDSIVIAYTSASPPAFSIGQYVANRAPKNVSEIFYRQVTGVSDDAASKRLTLSTAAVSVDDMVYNGSLSLSDEQPLFEVGEDGAITSVVVPEDEYRLTSFPLVYDLSGETMDLGDLGTLRLDRAFFFFTPEIRLDRQRYAGVTERFSGSAGGHLIVDFEPTLVFTGLELEKTYSKSLLNKKWLKFAVIGKVPVWVVITFDLTAKAQLEASSRVVSHGHIYKNTEVFYGVVYDIYTPEPHYKWGWTDSYNPDPGVATFSPLEWQGEASVSLHLIPSLNFGLYEVLEFDLGAVNASFDASVAAEGSATATTSGLESASLRVYTNGEIGAGLDLPGFDEIALIDYPVSIFSKEWQMTYPEPGALEILEQPQDAALGVGDRLVLKVVASSQDPITYEWYKDGALYQHGGDRLVISRVSKEHAGEYYVKLKAGGEPLDSEVATVTVNRWSGSGTEADPFRVSSVEDLLNINDQPDAHYRLVSDINMSGHTYRESPIVMFSGYLDGNGHTISHFRLEVNGLSGSGAVDLGLFGNSNGVLENIELTDAQVRLHGTIDEVEVRFVRVGTLAGMVKVAKQCRVEGSVVVDVTSVKPVDSYMAERIQVGGLAGSAVQSSSTIEILECATDVDVSVKVVQTGSSEDSSLGFFLDVGGLLGRLYNTGGLASVDSCQAKGDVQTDLRFALVQNVNQRQFSVGGLIGYGGTTAGIFKVTNSYARNSVSANGYWQYDENLPPPRIYLGGFIGINGGNDSGTHRIEHCYSIVELSSSGFDTWRAFIGGFAGRAISSNNSNYFDSDAAGMETSDAATGVVQPEMWEETTFVDWDFDTIWVMGPYGPTLRKVDPMYPIGTPL